jgi:hypothetical protein
LPLLTPSVGVMYHIHAAACSTGGYSKEGRTTSTHSKVPH